MILWVSIRQSIEYRINTGKWQNKLVTFDSWKVVALECNESNQCIESSDSLVSRFYNDPKLREFKEARSTRSFRIKTNVSDIPGIENILNKGRFSVVIPKTDTRHVLLRFFTKDKHLNKLKFSFQQMGIQTPIFFQFDKGNPGFPSFDLEDDLEIDFHLYENGMLGTKNFPIGFVSSDFHADFFNAVGTTASKDKNGEVQAILGIVFVAFLSFFKRRHSSYLSFLMLLMAVFARTVVVYWIENKIFSDYYTWLWQSYFLLELAFTWSLLVMYLQVNSLFLSKRSKKFCAIIIFGILAGSLFLEKQFGFEWWSGLIWKIDPYFNIFPGFLVLLFGTKRFIQNTKEHVPAHFNGMWKHGYQNHPELFFLSIIFVAFSVVQLPVFVNQNSISLPYSHAAFLVMILILKETLFYKNDQKLIINTDILDSVTIVQKKIEDLKQKNPMPYLAYLNQQKAEIAFEFASVLIKSFGAISGNSAKVRIYQSPITDVLPYQEFLLSDFWVQKNRDLLLSSSPLGHMKKKEITDFIESSENKLMVNVFANHSLEDLPYFSLVFEIFKNASFGREGEREFLTKGIRVFSTRISLLVNHVHSIFYENDPVLKQLGYQSILQVKSDFTFQRRVPALMIDVRGYSKLILQKELGCLDKNGNPVDLNHSQILNLLFKPFLDLAYKHKLTRIGPNGDSLILFGPVEQEERNKCTIMLKAALDARELYEMHLEEFKHQHQLHPDSHSKVTLQFGRALGFGEIKVNLIGGSYTGQLDYHTETINLLARVEKFTKKMNTDFLITQDFLNELNQETAQSGAALHDIVIRYLGSYDFDASAQKVKLYQAGYAHKLRELFSPSKDFDQAILNMDQKFYEKSLEFLHNHLALYPQDVTALAIQALCKTHLSLN